MIEFIDNIYIIFLSVTSRFLWKRNMNTVERVEVMESSLLT